MRKGIPAFAALLLVLGSCGNALAAELEKSATATGGMVAAAHPSAVEAGLEMLRKGGNAVDAAVATAFALTVVEPFGSSIGGDGIGLVYSRTDNKVMSYAYRCQAPSTVSRELFDYSDEQNWRTTTRGPAVPGMVMGTLAMHEDYGLLSRQEVMAPAIRFAREGFEVGPTLAGLIADMYEPLSEKEEAAKIYLEDLFPPEVGSVLRNPELAVSLELIAEGGADVMYTGPLAKKIASYLQANGGVLSAEDFASYAMIKSEPLRVKYKNYEVYSAPPPFGGIAVLEALQLYERIDTSKYPGPHSAENIHAMAEVMKLTSADRYDVAGDPRFVKMPTDWLISEEYADLRIKDFNPAKATVPDDVDPGLVWKDRNASGSTTHLTVVDSQGNAVVLTQTLGTFFGSTIVVPGTGILLNDQMKNFSGRSSSPNKLEPRKSMNSTQAPTIVLKDNELVLAVGSPGAYRILTTVFQFLVYALDYDMRLQDANDAPRITARDIYDELRMESRIAEDVRKKLEAMGHVLQVQGEHDLYFGGVHAVARDPKTGMLTGSADLRRDGVAGGFEKEPAASAR